MKEWLTTQINNTNSGGRVELNFKDPTLTQSSAGGVVFNEGFETSLNGTKVLKNSIFYNGENVDIGSLPNYKNYDGIDLSLTDNDDFVNISAADNFEVGVKWSKGNDFIQGYSTDNSDLSIFFYNYYYM